VRVEKGGGNEDAHIVYKSGQTPDPNSRGIHITLSMDDSMLIINGNNISDVCLDYATWHFLVASNIDWEHKEVGKLSLDGTIVGENIAFRNPISSIETISFRLSDWGPSKVYFDDVSIY
jgi:hypothetical protein